MPHGIAWQKNETKSNAIVPFITEEHL